jgi:hypothetical protein
VSKAKAKTKATETGHPRDWREARKAGRVWCKLSINGGPVKLCGQPIGRMQSSGSLTPTQGLIVYMAACGRTLAEIQAYLTENNLEG